MHWLAPLEGTAGTGLSVAAIRAEETARPDRLFADPLAGAFAAASGWPPLRRPGDRRAAALRIWVVARTVFLDELLASAGEDGVRQVVLLGAGFDARAFRLPWPPRVRCFELDTADVLDRKADVLTAQSAEAGCERIPVACDLRADWPAALLAAGLRAGQPTVWIAEGLLVYLSSGDVDRVLTAVTSLSAPGSRLGLTLSNRGPAAGDGQERVSRAMTLRRSHAPDDPVRWLAGHGWAAQVSTAREVLGAHGRPLPSPDPPQDQAPRALLISAARDASRPRRGPARSSDPAASTGPAQRRAAAAARPAVRAPGAGPQTGHLPLPTLVSQVLVAFTIEFDNEFEHQMPHRTTWGPAAGSRRGPWLVSLPMWSNFMQFLPADGATLRELADLPELTNLAGLQRWGYVAVGPGPADTRPRPPRPDWVVRPTPAGRRAQDVWRPLAEVIEGRWQERSGAAGISGLRAALQALASQFDVDLPRYLPVAGVSKRDHRYRLPARREADAAARLDLPALLSQVLLAFTIDFERESRLSLAISANALRVLTETGVRVSDLPRRAGVSKEAISVSLGFLERHDCVMVEPDLAASRLKLARLTPGGRQAQDACGRILGAVEASWRERFGAAGIAGLRESLEALVDKPRGGEPPLSLGLVPYPDGWRAHNPYVTQTTAMIRDPRGTLPHHPMVSHRGGFPDGS
jgi:methyltransferase (TIGR00027 family)